MTSRGAILVFAVMTRRGKAKRGKAVRGEAMRGKDFRGNDVLRTHLHFCFHQFGTRNNIQLNISFCFENLKQKIYLQITKSIIIKLQKKYISFY